ncbi:MAG TPA: ABC transporter ATP-binding protein [Ferrovibrio sp.]|uniref:ABC transporter ATP-binding protein n=1 Tax=Ferrovibrio sp. TaxID=1917215 RepID=UPI002ED3DF60
MTADTGGTILSCDGLYAGYGSGDVLFGISFGIGCGEVLSLIGRNGAGKSTTMKSIVRLVRPTDGTILFKGNDLSGSGTHSIARMGIAYVPEDRRIFQNLTIEENLLVTRKAAGPDRWPLQRIYEVFPTLARMRRNLGSEMSGGEQQMLAIARALVGNPDLVLLDEPSEGLAPIIVDELIKLVLALKQSGIAIIVSEQNLGFAKAVSDKACVMDRGVIRYNGSYAGFAANDELMRSYMFASA